MEYQTIQCVCGEQARIVESGVGTYIRCVYCGRETYMCSTKEDAVKKFEEVKKRERNYV